MQDGEIIDYSRKDGHHYVFGASSKAYEDNYDRIFRKKVKHGKKKWIQKAIKHPGAFSAKAKKAHMSTSKYATKVLKNPRASTTLKRQASLAKTMMGMHRKMHGK